MLLWKRNRKEKYLEPLHSCKWIIAFGGVTKICYLKPLLITVQYLMQRGVVAIVGPMTSTGVKFTQPYCAGFHIPQLAPVATDPTFSFTSANFPYLVRLSPSDTIQCQALAGLISHYNWTQFALLTSKDDYGLCSFLSLSNLISFPGVSRIWLTIGRIVYTVTNKPWKFVRNNKWRLNIFFKIALPNNSSY